MIAGDVLDRVEVTLNDIGFTRWTSPELIRHLGEAQREAARLQPSSTAKTESVLLNAGETRHQMPDNTSLMIAVTRNMGSDGATAGKVITFTDRDTLNRSDPNRHSSRGKPVMKHLIYDPDNPLEFESYPKTSDSVAVYVEMIYSVSPPDLVDSNGVLTVINKYVNALTDYVLFRALSKDAQYAGEDGRSMKHYNLFTAGLGLT